MATANLSCSGEQPIDVSWITWFYELPKPLAQGVPRSWAIPQYTQPAHCQRIRDREAGQLNVDFLQHANHPCTFLSQGIQLPATLEDVLPGHSVLKLPQPGVV